MQTLCPAPALRYYNLQVLEGVIHWLVREETREGAQALA